MLKKLLIKFLLSSMMVISSTFTPMPVTTDTSAAKATFETVEQEEVSLNAKTGLYLTESGSNVILSQDTTATTAVANNKTLELWKD